MGFLVRQLASGAIAPDIALPALGELTGNELPPSALEIVEALEGEQSEALRQLAIELEKRLGEEAWRLHRSTETTALLRARPWLGNFDFRRQPWRKVAETRANLLETFSLLRTRQFLAGRAQEVPRVMALVEKRFLAAAQVARENLAAWGLTLDVTALEAQAPPAMTLQIRALAEQQKASTVAQARTLLGEGAALPETLPDELPAGIDLETAEKLLTERLLRGSNRAERQRALDLLCSWPTALFPKVLSDPILEPWARRRAGLIFAARFGQRIGGWPDWCLALGARRWEAEESRRVLEQWLRREAAAEALQFWLSQQGPGDPPVDPTIAAQIAHLCSQSPPIDNESFLEAWGRDLTPGEARILGRDKATEDRKLADSVELGLPPAAAEPATDSVAVEKPGPRPALPATASQPATASLPAAFVPTLAARPVKAAAAPTWAIEAAQRPTLWEEHVRPFFSEYWYLVAGVLMTLVGASTVAFFTWDTNWLLRYTILPALLAIFTVALAAAGSWLEAREARLRMTATILRGAAIALVPVNFLAILLLSGDAGVVLRAMAVPVLGLLYLGVFGYFLRRWCGAMDPRLAKLLGNTLLAANALIVAVAIVRGLALPEEVLRLTVLVGFHLGFFALMATVYRFCRDVLDRDVAAEKRLPVFLGAALGLTFGQVFLWLHSILAFLPKVSTYGLLVILCGGLILYVERRSLELRGQDERHSRESFLGFALILLGTLMAAADPWLRIAGFLLAGTVWLIQDARRNHPLSGAIGLSLLALGGASVGLLDMVPAMALPALGIGVALAIRLVGWRIERLGKTAAMLQTALLVLVAMVAPLAQWHERSTPWWTGAYLLIVALLMAQRAAAQHDLRLLHSLLAILALALPYFGFADMSGRALYGNAMVFGLALLSFLWLAVIRVCGSPPWLIAARSTGLLLFGSLSLAAMLLRVVVEAESRVGISGWHDFMDFSGPLLIALVLLVATYLTRSLVPALMAAVITAVLFPELQTDLWALFPSIAWGSGLGSAISALGLLMSAFFFRHATFLRELGPGDLYFGHTPFPLQRRDHTLLTLPILCVVFFLTLKVETWNLLHNLKPDGVGLRTSVALLLTSVIWLLLGLFNRQEKDASLTTFMSAFWLLVGNSFLLVELYGSPHWSRPPLLTLAVLQVLYFAYKSRSESWIEALFAIPTRFLLHAASLLLAPAIALILLVGTDPSPELLLELALFLAAQLVWHGLRTGRQIQGALLFVLVEVCLVSWATPGNGVLALRLQTESLTASLFLILAVQLLVLALERRPELCARISPLLHPFLLLASSLASLLLYYSLYDGLATPAISRPLQVLLLLVVLLTAHAQASLQLLLGASLLGYLAILYPQLSAAATSDVGMIVLLEPWRLSLLALWLAALAFAVQYLRSEGKTLAGPFAHSFLAAPSGRWLSLPAFAAACGASLYQTFAVATRSYPAELATPYVGALALWLLSWSRLRRGLEAYLPGSLMVVLVTLGNLQVLRFYWHDQLLAAGLSETHLICLGLASTLLLQSLVRLRARGGVAHFLNRTSLMLAGLLLVLLAGNYLANPDLQEVTSARFLISGAMALLAGWYFRRAARQPGQGEEDYVELAESCYHFGLAIAFWCAALAVPALRHPATAMLALALPVGFFLLRAQTASLEPEARRYRISASVLVFALFALYVFRGAFQLTMFPGQAVDSSHYHHNALLMVVLGLVALRLRGLGGTDWLAFYGGLALIVGSYFALTWLPSLDPFEYPVAGAFCAVALGHFWTLAAHQRSPLRAGIAALAALDLETLLRLRRSWGLAILVGVHVAVALAIASAIEGSTLLIAPLLIAAASLVLHQGFLRGSLLYAALAAGEIVLAIHTDFLYPSYLPAEQAVWALLAFWALLLALAALPALQPLATLRVQFMASSVLAAITLAHVVYHHPGSPVGLLALAAAALLYAITPCHVGAVGQEEQSGASLLLGVPAFLAYFSQVGVGFRPYDGERPLLALAATLLGTGLAARFYQRRLAISARRRGEKVRLFHVTLDQLAENGAPLEAFCLWLVIALTTWVQVRHYQEAFARSELFVICAIHAVAALAWWGRERASSPQNSPQNSPQSETSPLTPSFAPYVLLQAHLLLLFAVLRRQLMLASGFWTPEYDVWASLLVSVSLAGAKDLIDLRPREVRLPLLGSMALMPLIALGWVLFHGLGADIALIVIGLHSLIYAYLGRHERSSPYHLVAVGAFVSFVLLAFWTKLELRVLPAYILPVGIGILLLSHLFAESLTRSARQSVRFFTLLAMVASTAWAALTDQSFPLALHATLLLLCLAAMALGSFFRIRLYLALGFTGLAIDLLAVGYRLVVGLERSSRMTVFGALVLTLGVLLVFGAAYYKTRQDQFDAQLESWRQSLKDWE